MRPGWRKYIPQGCVLGNHTFSASLYPWDHPVSSCLLPHTLGCAAFSQQSQGPVDSINYGQVISLRYLSKKFRDLIFLATKGFISINQCLIPSSLLYPASHTTVFSLDLLFGNFRFHICMDLRSIYLFVSGSFHLIVWSWDFHSFSQLNSVPYIYHIFFIHPSVDSCVDAVSWNNEAVIHMRV